MKRSNVKIKGVLEFSFPAENLNEAEDLVNDPNFLSKESGLRVESIKEASVYEEDSTNFTGHCVISGVAEDEEALHTPILVEFEEEK